LYFCSSGYSYLPGKTLITLKYTGDHIRKTGIRQIACTVEHPDLDHIVTGKIRDCIEFMGIHESRWGNQGEW
jgi:hypothetical protein